MRRRLFTSASLLSLLFCAATTGLWARSYRRATGLFYHLNGATVVTVVRPGSIEFAGYRERPGDRPNRVSVFDEESDLPSERGDEWVTYLLFTQPQIRIPFWLLVGLSLILPSAWTLKRLRATDRTQRCPTCSYNLTANQSGTCPECGTPIVAPLQSAKSP